MAIVAYGEITILDLIDTATYIYYSANSDGSGASKTPGADTKYIGIYSGAPFKGGQPSTPPKETIWTKYVGENGSGFYKIITKTRRFTQSKWNQYNTPGHIENWTYQTDTDTPISNATVNAHIKINDTAYVSGVITDKNNIECVLIGTVVSISSNGIALKTTSFIASGEKGEKGEQGNKGDKGDTGNDGQMLYATCSTPANTSPKKADLQGDISTLPSTLPKGTTVTVNFTYSNTIQNPQLNIANSGNKNIWLNGKNLDNDIYYWLEGDSVVFVYDGEHWVMTNASALIKAGDFTVDLRKLRGQVNDAAKTATNFLYFGDSGLEIGYKNSNGAWGGNRTQITSNSFNILNNNGSILASYSGNNINLGVKNDSASISMCNNKLNFSYGELNTDYNTVGFTGSISQISSTQVLALSAPNALGLFSKGTNYKCYVRLGPQSADAAIKSIELICDQSMMTNGRISKFIINHADITTNTNKVVIGYRPKLLSTESNDGGHLEVQTSIKIGKDAINAVSGTGTLQVSGQSEFFSNVVIGKLNNTYNPNNNVSVKICGDVAIGEADKTKRLTITGFASIIGDASITGKASIKTLQVADASITGKASIKTLQVADAATIQKLLTVNGNGIEVRGNISDTYIDFSKKGSNADFDFRLIALPDRFKICDNTSGTLNDRIEIIDTLATNAPADSGQTKIRATKELGLYGYAAADAPIYVTQNTIRTCVTGQHSLGVDSFRWSTAYLENSPNTTSDRNLKKDITPLNDKYISLFNKLTPVSYILTRPGSIRKHIGFVSQEIEESMIEVGLSDLDFGGFCKDIKIKEVEIKDPETGNVSIVYENVLDENGEPVYEYSLRYTEFIALNTKMIQLNQQKISEQEEKIQKLEEKIELLEQRLKFENSLNL